MNFLAVTIFLARVVDTGTQREENVLCSKMINGDTKIYGIYLWSKSKIQPDLCWLLDNGGDLCWLLDNGAGCSW